MFKKEFPYAELSESSLDVFIPSYPGSPRSLNIGPRTSVESIYEKNPIIGTIVEFLHQDKEFLMAAEIGNDKLLEIFMR